MPIIRYTIKTPSYSTFPQSSQFVSPAASFGSYGGEFYAPEWGALEYGVYGAAIYACFATALTSTPITSVAPPIGGGEPVYGKEFMSLTLRMVRGDTYTFDIAVTLNGDPVNLTGGVLTMTAKWQHSDLDAAAVFVRSSATGGISVTDALNGLATITIAPVNTRSLPAREVRLFYDIQLVDASGNVYTVLRGILIVVPDTTITV